MRSYKLKRQGKDERDYPLRLLIDAHIKVKIPTKVDLRQKCPAVYDQGNLGSCTANAGVAARTILDNLNVSLSRLFLYYNERMIEGNTENDSGASMRDIGKAIVNYGICPESDDPYVVSNFAKKPADSNYTDARNYKIKSYYSVSTMDQIKQVLAIKQQPVLIGIDVYESFESDNVARTGKIPLPKPGEMKLGGHAILVVGYNDSIFGKYFICRNSWGESWGDKGYFYLPYSYFEKGYAYDFWVLQN